MSPVPERNYASAGEDELDSAYAVLQQSLKEERTAETTFAMAEINFARKRYNDAVYFYEEAIKIDPSFHAAYERVAECLLISGHPLEALNYYGLAIQTGILHYKQRFVRLVARLQLRAFNADLKDLVLTCLQAPAVDVFYLGNIWKDILRFDPVFKDVYKAGQKDSYDEFRKSFSRMKDYKALLSPFFLDGLRRVVVFDAGFERFLTFLRRYILENLNSKSEYKPLTEAMSLYCVRTEYILFVSDEEKEKLKSLQDAVLLGCYCSLYKNENAAQLKVDLPQHLVSAHFTEFEKQSALKSEISSHTIKDEVSSNVQQQYEEFPYPRWINFDSTIKSEFAEGYLREGTPHILVAGCGTGREAMELASVFPHAKVLAIDLSLSSLGYALMKAKEAGLQNIEFRQMDILDAGTLNQTFDFIACSGVLHHMKVPEEGLSVLEKLLKPSGVMRLAFYSELARQGIVAAREIIAEKGYGSDAESIRRFRHDARGLLRMHVYSEIADNIDYYFMSECHDLLFHVQEHRYTMIALRDLLNKFGLCMVQFYQTDDVLAHYRKDFPGDEAAINLDNWAKFETRNPRTFREMYRFWVRKAV